MSLSFVISPAAAEPNKMILSGRATLNAPDNLTQQPFIDAHSVPS
jgi:hypothetical protein